MSAKPRFILTAGLIAGLVSSAGTGWAEEAPEAEVSYSAGLDWLFQDWPGLSRLAGLARVRTAATGTPAGLATEVRVTAFAARLDGLDLGSLELHARTPAGGGVSEVTVRLDGPAGRVTGTFRLGVHLDPDTGRPVWEPGPLQGRLQASELHLDRLTRAWPVLALGGSATLTVTVGGAPEKPEIQGTFAATGVTFRGERVGDVALRWEHGRDSTALDIRLGPAEAPVAALKLKVPLALDLRAGSAVWRDDGDHRLELSAHGLTAERARPFWRSPGGVDFKADLDLAAAGPLDRLDGSGTLAGEWLTRSGGRVPFRGKLLLRSDEQGVDFELGDGLFRLALKTRIPLAAVRRSGQALEPSPLTGRLDVALPLDVAAPLLPDLIDTPEGLLKGVVEVSGTLGAPVLAGRLQTRDATATLLPLNRRVRDLELVVTVQGDQWKLDSFEGHSGPGLLSGTGSLRFTPTPDGADATRGLWGDWRLSAGAELQWKDFPVVHPDLPVGKARAVIDLAARARPGDASVEIGVGGGNLVLTPEQVPRAASIPTNPGVRVLDWLKDEASGERFLAGSGHLGLTVALREPLRVHGEGIDLTLEGKMVMNRHGPVVRVEGGIEVVPGGSFHLFKNRFQVQRGILTLAEGRLDRRMEAGPASNRDPDAAPEAAPLEPVLDFTARGRVEGTHVLVKVLGPAGRPQLVLSSVPALPEYQIMTLLIVGRVDVVDDRGGEVRREVARMVNRFHNPSLKRQFFDCLGVDNLGLGFASASQPVLTVGKQVKRELYIETVYHANAPPGRNTVTGHVNYLASPQWTLDTSFGDAGESGLGIFWHTTFGGPALPPPPDEKWGLTERTRPDTDGDGLADPYDLCADRKEDPDGFEDDDGCPDPDNDRDGLADGLDQDRDRPETFNGFEDTDGLPDTAPPELQDLQVRLRRFYYAEGSARLDAAGESALKAAAFVIRGLPRGVRVEVQGHANASGTPAVNLAVSQARAQEVKQRLQALGVRNRAIDAVGYGDTRPLQDATTPEAQEHNRRIELRLYYERGAAR